MASFRRVPSPVVGQPLTRPDPTNGYSEFARIIAEATRGAQTVVAVQQDQLNQDNADLAATRKIELAAEEARKELEVSNLRAEARTLESAASIANTQARQLDHMRAETLKIQERGLPQLLASTPDSALSGLLKAHPHLLPEVQEQVANYAAKRLASQDYAILRARIASDPTADVEQVGNEIATARLAEFQDPLSASIYRLSFDEMKLADVGKALIEGHNRERLASIDQAFADYQNNIAQQLYANTLPDRFGDDLDGLVDALALLDPDKTRQDVEAAALSALTAAVIGPAGRNIGANPETALAQIEALASKHGEKYPQLQGIAASLRGDIAQAKGLQSKAIEGDLLDMISGSDRLALLDSINASIAASVQAGDLSVPQAVKLAGKVQERREKIALTDEVYRALGSDPLDPEDNAAVRLGTHHHEAIDQIADRQGLQGTSRSVWMVRNFGFLTSNEINELRVQASTNDPAQFANAFATFNQLYRENPVYAYSLTESNALPERLQAAVSLSVFAGEDARLIASMLTNVTDEQLSEARDNLFKPKTPGSNENPMGLRIASIRDIGRKLDAEGSYDKRVQDAYLSALSLYAATLKQTMGQADPANIYHIADKRATEFLKRNVSVQRLADRKYMVFNRRLGDIGFDSAQWKNVDSLWRKERGRIADELGVSRSALSLSINEAQRVNGELVVPVLLDGLSDFALEDGERPVTYAKFPLDRIALKQQAEGTSAEARAAQADSWTRYIQGNQAQVDEILKQHNAYLERLQKQQRMNNYDYDE